MVNNDESYVSDQLDANVRLPKSSKVLPICSAILRQSLAASASILCAISVGTVVGYSAILLPQIREQKFYNFSSEQESWIAAGATLPMAPSCILGGLLMEFLGRKLANISVMVLFLLGWVLIYFSIGFPTFLLGRLLQGISLGISGPLNSVFVGETTNVEYRGVFLAGLSLGYTFGILFTHLVGTFCTWKNTALLCGAVSAGTFFAFCAVPESPSFLLRKGKVNEAYEVFTWFRGSGTEALAEFDSMLINKNKEDKESFTKIVHNMLQPNFYKPFFILLGMFFVLQFAGVNVIVFYTVFIMKETSVEMYDEYFAMIIIDFVRFIIGIVACIAIRKIRRKPLFIISGLGTGISLLCLSVFLYASQLVIQLGNFSFISLLLMLSYICFSSLGILPLPWCLIGELFPCNIRGVGSGLAAVSNFIFFFAVIKTAPFLFTSIGIEGSFVLYGCVTLIGTIILHRNFPETDNRTLQEIEETFR